MIRSVSFSYHMPHCCRSSKVCSPTPETPPAPSYEDLASRVHVNLPVTSGQHSLYHVTVPRVFPANFSCCKASPPKLPLLLPLPYRPYVASTRGTYHSAPAPDTSLFFGARRSILNPWPGAGEDIALSLGLHLNLDLALKDC